ncbi:MAG: 6,7-dimethyl-8-ribityllumazine synthase [Verrucomicrobiae bacterium]|nr:6,7-dimethyl-8-ribityllumazine synthase [Verrucomicrobiae bacterium]
MKPTDLSTIFASVPRARAACFRIGVIAARYNRSLCDALLESALATLAKLGARKVVVCRVPGAYEIPVLAARMARSGNYDVLVALGVVLQGGTSHAEHLAAADAVNLQRLAVETEVPVIHQVLTPRTEGDARARVRLRGEEAARAAVEMAATMGTAGRARKGERRRR